MTPVLSLFDVHKRYGERAILACDELSLYPGEIVHLTGRNGAGKTTLLKIIAGLERPDRAQIAFGVRRGPWHREVRNLRRRVVYLHQRPFMFDASVTANLTYGLRAAGLARTEFVSQIAEALQRMDLAHLAERNARTLSGGEQQRLALARAWVLHPQVLLLDEPTANMDAEFREQTWALLRSMANRRLCMVITNHETNGPALDRCRRLHLDHGRLMDQPESPSAKVIPWPGKDTHHREARP